jgi:hypothetical protein
MGCLVRGSRTARTVGAATVAGVLAALLGASGCATASRSTSDERVFVESHPSGASIFVNGGFAGTTPGLVEMPRDRMINVVCRLDGYEDASVTVHREVARAVAFDTPAFAVVDAITGAAYPLQRRTLSVELTPKEGRQP